MLEHDNMIPVTTSGGVPINSNDNNSDEVLPELTNTPVPDEMTQSNVDYVSNDDVKNEEVDESPDIVYPGDPNHHPNAIHYKDIPSDNDDNLMTIPHTTTEDIANVVDVYLSDKEHMEKYNSLLPEQKLAINILTLGFGDNGLPANILESETSKDWDYDEDKPLLYNVGYNDKPDNNYTGHKAELAMATSLGLNPWGVIILPHTGIRLTIDSIPESDFSSLDITIRQQLSEVGRRTDGLIFSNTTAVYDEILIDFILSRVKNSTLNVSNMLELKKHISILDKPILIGGLLRNMYPRGFSYATSCGNMTEGKNGEKTICGNVYRMDVSVESLYKVNKKRITESMNVTLSKRLPRSVSIEEMKAYKDEVSKGLSIIDMGTEDNLKVHLEIPVLKEGIASGMYWVDRLTMIVNDTIHIADPEERELQIDKLLFANKLTEYMNIITKIESDISTIDKNEGIFNILQLIMSDKDKRDILAEGIMNFLKESIIAVMGTKAFKCTDCGHIDKGPNEDFRSIITISDMSVFLNLRRLKEVTFQV